jgi:hypothetical protein
MMCDTALRTFAGMLSTPVALEILQKCFSSLVAIL